MNQLKEILKSPLALMSLALIGGLAILSLSEMVNGDYGIFPGMLPILIGATFFMILLAYGNAIYDAGQLEIIKRNPLAFKRGTLNHPKRFILRALAAALFSLAVFRELSVDMGMLTVYQGAIFWLFFDPFLAIKRELDWHYLSTWYRTSKLDLIFRGSKALWLLAKLALCGASLWFLL